METHRELNFRTLPKLADGKLRYPRGWFLIGQSTDFKTGETRALRYFETDLIAWRAADGTVSVFEAYCPHRGAHLGYCPKTNGAQERLRCPLHGAEFDKAGRCLKPPRGQSPELCETMPLTAWTARELNGIVAVWHDPEGGTPDFELPILPEYGDDNWTDWMFKKMELHVHPREVIENIADKAHFVYVHNFEKIITFENAFAGHLATQRMYGSSNREELGEMHSESLATYFGPAYQITWMDNNIFKSRLLNAHTPIDDTHTDLWFGVLLHKQGLEQMLIESGVTLEAALSEYAQTVHEGFEQDVSVWRKKLYRTEPMLCDGDGPFAKCRKWYQQFYEDRNAERDPSSLLPHLELNPHLKQLAL